MKRYSYLILLIALTSGLAYPQTKGRVSGRVSDQDGKPLAYVKVEVCDTPTATQTLPDGTFALENLAPRKYRLRFTHPEYL
ncbi:MAG: carboxypeptidase-like regulatory domain-containing protein, partial [Candidatus Aminicenantes bacterium]|nr:carboxypeptidase-like regulatory domain-containing protein [Candidatus Aminicenantes bacterium]